MSMPPPDPLEGAEPEPQPSPPSKSGMASLLRYFLGLGTWGFGGPIATVLPTTTSTGPPR